MRAVTAAAPAAAGGRRHPGRDRVSVTARNGDRAGPGLSAQPRLPRLRIELQTLDQDGIYVNCVRAWSGRRCHRTAGGGGVPSPFVVIMKHSILEIALFLVAHLELTWAFSLGMTRPPVLGCSRHYSSVRTPQRLLQRTVTRNAVMKEDWLEDKDESGFTQAQRSVAVFYLIVCHIVAMITHYL